MRAGVDSLNRTTLEPGTPLRRGSLTVQEVIGFGGSGIIYSALEQGTGLLVAVKETFPQGCSRDHEGVRAQSRMDEKILKECCDHAENEALVLGNFEHPGILKVHSTFAENGTIYTVMELLEGHDLRHLMLTQEELSQDLMLDYLGQVAAALQVLHERGLIHGDVKPENLFVTDDGRVVLLDFGAAIYYRAGKAETKEMTRAYAAPEQYSANRMPEGPLTDLYCLCATFYHFMTGHLAPAGETRRGRPSLVPLHHHRPDLSEQVSAAIGSGLEFEPERRPSDLETLTALAGAPPSRFVNSEKLDKAWQTDGRMAGVRAVAFSADGRLCAVGSQTGTTTTFNLETHREEKKARLMPAMSDLDLNYQGNRFVVGSDRGQVKLFRDDGTELACLYDERRVGSVAFSPDNRHLVAGLFDGRVLVWDGSGQVAYTLKGHESMVKTLVFSPDSSLLLTGSHDGSVRLWRSGSDQLLHHLEGHSEVLYAAQFTPDNQLLATASGDGTARVWWIEKGLYLRIFHGKGDVPRGLGFSPDANRLAVAYQSGELELFDIATGRSMVATNADKRVIAMTWSGHGLVTVSEGCRLRGWKVG